MPVVFEQRFAEAVRKLLGLREATSLDLLPDLMPVLPLADAHDPAMALPRGERLLTAGVQGTAAAGQFPVIWIENGVNVAGQAPRTDALVLTSVSIWSNTSQVIRMRADSGLVTPGAPTPFVQDDDRISGAGVVPRIVFESSAVVLANAGIEFIVPLTQVIHFPLQKVLRPGMHFLIGTTTAATQIGCIIRGYTRAMGQAEFRF